MASLRVNRKVNFSLFSSRPSDSSITHRIALCGLILAMFICAGGGGVDTELGLVSYGGDESDPNMENIGINHRGIVQMDIDQRLNEVADEEYMQLLQAICPEGSNVEKGLVPGSRDRTRLECDRCPNSDRSGRFSLAWAFRGNFDGKERETILLQGRGCAGPKLFLLEEYEEGWTVITSAHILTSTCYPVSGDGRDVVMCVLPWVVESFHTHSYAPFKVQIRILYFKEQLHSELAVESYSHRLNCNCAGKAGAYVTAASVTSLQDEGGEELTLDISTVIPADRSESEVHRRCEDGQKELDVETRSYNWRLTSEGLRL